MKKMWIVVGLLLWIGVTAVAVSVCDYRAPETSFTDAQMSFTYRYYDDATTDGVDINSGRVDLDYDQLYDSVDYGFTISGTAEVQLDSFLPTGWLGQAGATYRYYLLEDSPVFAYGDVQASMATGQIKPGVEARFGGGYGRFSDVTPMAKALSIQAELLRMGAIPHAFADDTAIAIAKIIGREMEYASVKELVSDIEALVNADGGVTLDARQILTVEDIVQRAGDDRQCGWAVQAGIGYELIDPFGNPQNIVVAAKADAAFAPDPDSQFMMHASVSGPFDIMNENTLSANATYTYAMVDGSTFSAKYTLQRVQQPTGAVNMSHAATFGLAFDIGGADMLLQLAMTRDTGEPGWSFDISLSASLNLL